MGDADYREQGITAIFTSSARCGEWPVLGWPLQNASVKTQRFKLASKNRSANEYASLIQIKERIRFYTNVRCQ